MAKFLTTTGTAHQIESIIMDAKRELTLVSPYLQLSKTFFERLRDASERNVSITVIYGKDELKPNERNSLAQLDNVKLYYFENLHAKCFFNEEKMVITSMNMYEFSMKTNREMGVLIDAGDDENLYSSARNEALSIINSAEQDILIKSGRGSVQNVLAVPTSAPVLVRGYCIRCAERIEYNDGKPYCTECYKVWAQYKNPDYEESFCHKCGEYQVTTITKPRCYRCYKSTDVSSLVSYSIDDMHKELTAKFPKEKITKAKTYIYFSGVLPRIDAFIEENKLIFKFTSKEAPRNRILPFEKTLKSIGNYQIATCLPSNDYSYWRWDLQLKTGSASEIEEIISTLRNK